MDIGEFHWTDGWYFMRLADGSVRIRKTLGSATDQVIAIIPPHQWASIVGHVGHGSPGDEDAKYQQALALHV